MKTNTAPEPHSIALLVLLLAASGLFAQDLTSSTIAADRSLWPKSVVVSIPIEAPVIIAGKTSGSMKLPAGEDLPAWYRSAGEKIRCDERKQKFVVE